MVTDQELPALTRTRATRSRTATIIRDLGEPKGPAQAWAIAQLKMTAIAAEQVAALAEAVEAIRDILLVSRASTP